MQAPDAVPHCPLAARSTSLDRPRMLVRRIETNDFAGLVIAVAVSSAALAAWAGPGPMATGIVAIALAIIGLRIVWQDLADFTIPDAATLALGLIGLAGRIGDGAFLGTHPVTTIGFAAVDAAICGGVLLALRETYYRLRGHDGIGLGDVKLAAAGGVLLGTVGLSLAILSASLTGLAIVGAGRMLPVLARAVQVTDRIAFGAVLAPALWATWLVGQILPSALGHP
ncbi:A24 family peptidase [Methylobacterium sp. Leaf117]|uniref:prepilin peptidase n=1 Tax=Methylobacterium sp. Leaf117 TaxID=1736260 RepID=UPI0006F4CFCE|nr:A24 family peptidase [Methylobacterium sp. Leaf117]